MGNDLTCITTPKSGVMQGDANTLKKGAAPPPPPTGAGGGGDALHLSAEGVMQIAAFDDARKTRKLRCYDRSGFRLNQSCKLMKFDVAPCHSAHDSTSIDAFDISAIISAFNKFSATTKPLAPLSSEESFKTSMHQIFMSYLWARLVSISLKWTPMTVTYLSDVRLDNIGAAT